MLEDDRQAIVLIEWQSAQHHGVDDGEDRRAGADAEREDGEGDDGERGGRRSERSAALKSSSMGVSRVRRSTGRNRWP